MYGRVVRHNLNAGALIMALLTKAAVLTAELPREIVNVPEWGGDILVRGFTGKERDGLGPLTKGDNPTGFQVFTVKAGCLNPDGSQMFGPNDDSLIEALAAPGLERVCAKVFALSSIGPLAVEEAEGN